MPTGVDSAIRVENNKFMNEFYPSSKEIVNNWFRYVLGCAVDRMGNVSSVGVLLQELYELCRHELTILVNQGNYVLPNLHTVYSWPCIEFIERLIIVK